MIRTMISAKEQFKTVLEKQPEDATSEELMRELYLASVVEKGVRDSEAGRVIENSEVLKQIKKRS